MFFWTNQNETPLSEAVIDDDIETVKTLGTQKDHRNAKNYLGFNAVELAHYLDRAECLEILDPSEPRKFQVILRNEKEFRLLDEEELEQFFNFGYIPHLKFGDYKSFKKVVNSCPWLFRSGMTEVELHEYFDQIYKNGSIKFEEDTPDTPEMLAARYFQFQREISKGYFSDVTIQWLDEVLGYGLFTNRNLKKGEYVGEDIGVVHQLYRFRPHFNEYCLRYPKAFWSLSLFMIDAKFRGNEMRFANHSFEPNLVIKVAVDRGLLHILFFANQDIPKGTQLCYDYGEDYWAYREPALDI